MRIACVRVREAPLAALVRREPDLAGRVTVVLDASGAHGRVVACTSAARARGVYLGQTAHRARAAVPDGVVRVVDAGAVEAMRSALADAVASVAARIEPDGDRVYADAGEVSSLYGGEAGFVAAVTEAARRVGLAVDVGVAGPKTVARIAASAIVGGAIVPPGEEQGFLAPLALDALPLSSRVRVELARLGVRTVASLASLPSDALGTRLGPEAAHAVALARGLDPTPLFPKPHATRFEEASALEWDVSDVEALAFVVKRLLDALVARLACRSFAAGGLTLALALTDRTTDERVLQLASPTRDVSVLVHLARASLEARPPPDAVTAVRVLAHAAPVRPLQLGLFDPPGPAPDALALTLARLVALVGEGRVGTPVVPDTHRPGAFALAPYSHEPGVRHAVARSDAFALALHVFRPARVAEVTVAHGLPVHIEAGDIRGRVQSCAGPFRVAGDWWSTPHDHDSFDIALSDGGVYVVGHDHVAGVWRVEGAYE